MNKKAFTSITKAADFNQGSYSIKAGGGIKPLQAQTVRGRSSLTGFTLIELLVIMAIIGIIIAVLVPAIGKVKDSARRAECANNLRQIGMAFYLYLDDHNEMFPPGGGGGPADRGPADIWGGGPTRAWEDKLKQGYIDDANVFICHATERVSEYMIEGELIEKDVTYKENYYGYNGYLGGLSYNFGPPLATPVGPPKKLSDVATPSATIMCADVVSADTGSEGYPQFMFSDRHSKGANILFVSGAVQWFSMDAIGESISGLSGDSWWGNWWDWWDK